MTEFQKQFTNKLKEIRIASGLSQEKLAEKLGVATKTVSYWENGHNAVTFNKIPLIAKALNVPVYKLFVFGDILSGDDDEISELLAREGIRVARRTVAKYREAMGIGSSAERKRAKRSR